MYVPFIGPLLSMKYNTRKYVLDHRDIKIECREMPTGETIVIRDKRLKRSGDDVVFAYVAMFAPQSKKNPRLFYDPGDWEAELDELFEEEPTGIDSSKLK